MFGSFFPVAQPQSADHDIGQIAVATRRSREIVGKIFEAVRVAIAQAGNCGDQQPLFRTELILNGGGGQSGGFGQGAHRHPIQPPVAQQVGGLLHEMRW